MAYRVSQPLAMTPSPSGDETKDQRRNRRRKRYIKSTTSKKPAPTRAAKEVESKGPKTLVIKPTKKKRTVVKYTDKDGSKVKSVERRSGKLIETRKRKGGKHSSYKSKKITNKDGSVRVKTKYSY